MRNQYVPNYSVTMSTFSHGTVSIHSSNTLLSNPVPMFILDPWDFLGESIVLKTAIILKRTAQGKNEDNLLQVTKYRIRLHTYWAPDSEVLNLLNSGIKSSPIRRRVKGPGWRQQTRSQRHSTMKSTKARHTADVPAVMPQPRDCV